MPPADVIMPTVVCLRWLKAICPHAYETPRLWREFVSLQYAIFAGSPERVSSMPWRELMKVLARCQRAICYWHPPITAEARRECFELAI